MNENEVREDIRRYLQLSNHPELTTRLDEMPEQWQEAIYNMISDLEFKKAQARVIAFNVSEDVAAVLGGKDGEFSKQYIASDAA